MITAILGIITVQTVWIIFRDIENILRRQSFGDREKDFKYQMMVLQDSNRIYLERAEFWEKEAKKLAARKSCPFCFKEVGK